LLILIKQDPLFPVQAQRVEKLKPERQRL